MVGVRSGKGSHHEGVGEYLRSARQKKRVSLEAASCDLHIPLKQLRGLEEGDYSVFSAELYARGAYALYAKYLGVETNMSSRAFYRSLSLVRERVPLYLHTPETFWQHLVHPRIILSAAGALLALIAGGYIAWQLQSFWHLPNLAIVSPENRLVHGSEVLLEGIAEEKSQVLINGEGVLLQGDASFSVPLLLHPGINHVKVEVKNAAGRVNALHIALLRAS